MGNCFDSYSSRKLKENMENPLFEEKIDLNNNRKRKKNNLIIEEKENKNLENCTIIKKEINQNEIIKLTAIIKNTFLFFNLTNYEM